MPTSQAEALKSLLSSKVENLCGLKDIGTARSWDYSLPTIGSHRSFTDRYNFVSDSTFFEIFKKDVNQGLPYQILRDAGVFKKNNSVVLFGGSILDIIFKRHGLIRDFDLRLVGEEYTNDESKCISKAKEFVASIFSSILRDNEKLEGIIRQAKDEGRPFHEQKTNVQEISVSRCRSTVTVHIPSFGTRSECFFQLTFAPTNNIEEMLAACQPHCTRLAIKDGAVVLDEMARFCIESTCVVLDTNAFVNYYRDDKEEVETKSEIVHSGRTVTSQLQRFIKYFQNKGFDIILPELDMDKVPRRNLEYEVSEVLALPSMIVVYNDVQGNHIMANNLSLPKKLQAKCCGNGIIGPYDSTPTTNVGESIHHNIRCLVNDVYDSFKFVAKGERYSHVFDFVPVLTPRMVGKSYETVADNLKGPSIPISSLTGYFSVTPPDQVIEKLISQPLRNNICQSGKLPKSFVFDEKALKELIDLEVDSLLVKIDDLRDTLRKKGLDKLVVPYPENVSTVDDLYASFYGSSGLKRKRED